MLYVLDITQHIPLTARPACIYHGFYVLNIDLILVTKPISWNTIIYHYDRIQLDVDIFKILYRLNCLVFYFVEISAMVSIVLEVHFSLLFLDNHI